MFSAAVVTANALTHPLDEPDLINKLHSFSADQTHATDYNSDVLLMDDSDNQLPKIDDLITLYPSALATYFAPSDLGGVRGMHSEHIHATSNWRNEGPCYDTIFVNTNLNKDGMCGLDIARIKQFFSFKFQGHLYPCAMVQWYSPRGDEPDEDTGMWIVEPDVYKDGKPITDIIHLDTIVRASHLIAMYGNKPLLKGIPFCYALELFPSYYVNNYIDHHAFEITFQFWLYCIPCTSSYMYIYTPCQWDGSHE